MSTLEKRISPYRSPELQTLGVKVDSSEAMDKVMYPWWLRLVPTSLWWGYIVAGDEVASKVQLDAPSIQAYATEELGDSCRVTPKDATIILKDDSLSVQPSADGGTCEIDNVVDLIEKASLSTTEKNTVRVPLARIAPSVTDAEAQELLDTIAPRLENDIKLVFGDKTFSFAPSLVKSWLVFSEAKGKLQVSIDAAKATKTLKEKIEKSVAKAPGIVTITTYDFQEVKRTSGGEGRTLDTTGTMTNLANYLMSESPKVKVATVTLPPQKKYIRSYSSTNTGISALIQHYADSHSGVYGVSMMELSGQRRQAGYNQSRNFFPASTYKVFVAYSVLRKVEAGKMKWTDQVTGGRSLAKCFDDMLVLSDNPCAETLTYKIGVTQLNEDIANLGLLNTRFVGPYKHRTTAADLSAFMASLQTGQLSINSASRDRFLSALNRNVYRQGIPAGVSGTVANKVGFIDGLLHDTAIVRASSGTYVLTIMTDGSSWASIAELAREIEKLRT